MKDEIKEIIILKQLYNIEKDENRKYKFVIRELKETIYKVTQYYLSTLVQYEKEFKKMPDEAVMMYNLLEGNK